MPITVQIRNQARVPLWYEGKFGVPYPPVRAASDTIDRFPCKTSAVGIRCEGNRLQLRAPFGVTLMLNGVLVPNPVLPIPEVYATKIRRWQAVWPELVANPWPIEEVPAQGCRQS
ncbi:nucleotidyltransferase family protein [Rhodomicrobium vannielii]|uniref:nucleotidyltransferase family protein n=1 Tax=Rhodomicrobium vannielii TaxID=1069 RepID=UPI003CCF9EC8